MANISKINVNGTEYNVTQSGAVSDVSLVYGSDKFGAISINEKGNVAVESLSKHVNIESVQGIQLKPTTNIIIDTTRRRIDPSTKSNEAHIEVKYDDKGHEGYPDDTSYGEFKVHARNFDLRCHDHGGIALQPCLCDHPNSTVPHFENKIKFESSRIAPITERIGTNDTVQVSDYSNEGGKGLEFGTFNNLHTSLFTKDYRFNKDGYVYAVNRGALETAASGKIDYPTQDDDTKDIKVNKQRIDASGITTDVSLKANWEEIVWVARQYADGKIQGGGGTGGVDQQWVIDNFCSSTRADGFLTGIPNPLQYITESEKHNFQISVKDMSTYDVSKGYKYANLNLEGNATVKVSALEDIELITKTNDIILSSTDKITQIGTKIKLYDVSIDGSGNVVECEGGNGIVTVEAEKGLSMGLTPNVNFLSTKISAKGNIQESSPKLGLMMLNNFDGSIYFDASNKEVHIPTDRIKEFFEDSTCTVRYQPTTNKAKTVVYEAGGVKPTKSTEWFVKNTDLNRWFCVGINSDQQAKKEPSIITEGTEFENPSYTPTAGLAEMAPGEMKQVDSIDLTDLFELVKHKDALLALLNA